MIEFFVSHSFCNDLKKLETQAQKLVKNKLKALSNQENPLLFSKKLKGYKNVYRFRMGNYRIVFTYEKQKITLEKLKHRKDIYLGLD